LLRRLQLLLQGGSCRLGLRPVGFQLLFQEADVLGCGLRALLRFLCRGSGEHPKTNLDAQLGGAAFVTALSQS
jgi:hypothetical protein